MNNKGNEAASAATVGTCVGVYCEGNSRLVDIPAENHVKLTVGVSRGDAGMLGRAEMLRMLWR